MVLLVHFSTGAVIVGSVDVDRIWGSELKDVTLCAVEVSWLEREREREREREGERERERDDREVCVEREGQVERGGRGR